MFWSDFSISDATFDRLKSPPPQLNENKIKKKLLLLLAWGILVTLKETTNQTHRTTTRKTQSYENKKFTPLPRST